MIGRTPVLAGIFVLGCSGASPEPPVSRAPAGRATTAIDERALAAQAAALVDAFVNEEAVLTRDGARVVFVSDRDGLPQLYVADVAAPTAPATRLLRWPERVGGPQLTADGAAVLFLSDRGSDERFSIHRLDLASGAVVELTPGGALGRDAPFLPPGAPDTMVFSARGMDDPASSIYVASVDRPGPARQVHRDDMPGFLTDVSRDGRSALLARYTSHQEQTLLRVDLRSGAVRPLYPTGKARAAIADAAFSADGRRVFVATDGGAEQALVLALDAATGREVGRFVELDVPTATLSSIEVAASGDLLAVTLHAGNRNEIRLLGARDLRPRSAVQMPAGAGGAGRFSEDGARLTAQWSTPAAPTDIVAIDTATGAVSRLRDEPRPSLDGLPAVDVQIVDVKAFDGTAIPVNVYRPAGASGKVPVLVRYHGGPAGWSSVGWSAMARFFLLRGFAWVEPNIRGSGGFGRAFQAADDGPRREDAFRDVEATARWVAAQPWADAGRMVVLGESYGGYVVLSTLIRHAGLWRAGIDMFGFVSLASLMASTSGLVRQNYLTEFGDPVRDAALLASLSPLADLDRIRAPLFVYAGANDPRVPRAESDLVVERLRARNGTVEYMLKDDEGHSLSRRENQIEFFVRVARFLETHVR
jgi:dipeptidyl aminopeptidase/acylaminoacyl peptidase